MAYNQRKDPLTNELFYPKRNNQLFASRLNQIRYNNWKALNVRLLKKPVDRPLHRNFLILNKLMNGTINEKVFHKEYLIGSGLNFNNYTGVDYIDNIKYFKMFNFVIIPQPDNYLKIIKK